MYGPGQIIWDLDKKAPVSIGDDVWDVDAYPKRHRHFIKHGGYIGRDCIMEIACPKTVAEAKELLRKGIIVPAPANIDSHCWQCGNWYNNCASFRTCPEWAESARLK